MQPAQVQGRSAVSKANMEKILLETAENRKRKRLPGTGLSEEEQRVSGLSGAIVGGGAETDVTVSEVKVPQSESEFPSQSRDDDGEAEAEADFELDLDPQHGTRETSQKPSDADLTNANEFTPNSTSPLEERIEESQTAAATETATAPATAAATPFHKGSRILLPRMSSMCSEKFVDTDRLIRQVTKTPYEEVHDLLHRTGWMFAAIALIAILAVPETRSFFVERAWSGKFFFFVTECVLWGSFNYLLGRALIPINYLPFLLIRMMVLLELQYEQEVASPQIKEEEPSRFLQWLVNLCSWPDSDTTPIADDLSSTPQGQLFTQLFLTTIFITASYILTRYCKLEIWHQENLALLGCFFCSLGGAAITLTAPAVPQRISVDFHQTMCKYWASFTLFLIAFMCLFLLQRLMKVVYSDEGSIKQRKTRMDNSFKLVLEVMITFFEIYLVVRYIRCVHPDISLNDGRPNLTSLIKGLPVPDVVQSALLETVPTLYFLLTSVMERYHLSLPHAMQLDPYQLFSL